MAGLGTDCILVKNPAEIVPDPAAAASDLPKIYTDECRSQPDDPTVRTCVFGQRGSEIRVALIGDSHAASWFPAIEAIADREGWELHTFFKGACAFSRAYRKVAGVEQISRSCQEWNTDLSRILAEADPFDIAFTSTFANHELFLNTAGQPTEQAAVDGFRAAWAPLISHGSTVFVIRDVPGIGATVQTCLQDHLDNPSFCDVDRSKALPQNDYSQAAARGHRGAVGVDMTEYFCTEDICPMVVGDVLVYRDGNHVTATYSRSLAPWLLRQIADQVTSR